MPSINTELGERALSKMQHEMDWKPLKERCLRVYPTWSGRHVDRILREYQRFLALKVATRDIYDTIVLAPVLLDAMWKQHILSTQQYYADCQLLLQANQILHYNSDAEINVSDSVREKRMELTKASLCMMFSGMYPLSSDAKGIWNYDYSANNNETTSGGAMDHALSSMMGGENNTVGELVSKDDDDDDDDGLPMIGRDDEEEEETQPELINMSSPKRPKSPKKDRQRHNARAPLHNHHPDLQDDESERRLLYVYSAGKVSKLYAYPHDTIMAIKAKIQRRMGVATHQQYLEWEGQELLEEKSIGHYGIPSDATLVLTKIRTIGHQQQIDTDILNRQDLLLDSHDQYDHDDDDDDHEDGRVRREERDDPEMRQKRHNINSPTNNRRRSRPSSPPKSPRPPKPPRLPQSPYSPSNNAEDDSYLTDPSAVVHDSRRRRQQALLNKLKIQSHDKVRHHGVVGDLSTIPSRPKPKSASSSLPLKVFVNTIMGFTITLTANASDTVDRLKHMIQEQEDIPSGKQILILDGVPLDDSQRLSEYMTNDSSLHILLRLQAGSSSVGSLGASSMSPNSTMATVPRKKNHTAMLLTRATGGNAGVTSKWR